MDDLIQQGVNALKSGDRESARKLLIAAVKQNPDNERAWGWLYNAANTDKERIDCLKQMVRINPKNEKANEMLNRLTSFEPPLQTPTSTARNKSPVSQKSHKKLWVIGSFLGIGIVGVICIVAFGVLFGNGVSTTPPTPEPTIIPTITSTPKPFTGKWQIFTKRSEFDSSTIVTLSLVAENSVEGWLTTTLPVLVLTCNEGEISTYVNLGMSADVEYGLDNDATVRVRFDQNQAFEMVADESTDGDALFFQDPYGMVIALLESREMVFGFTPFNANPAVTTFDLRGLVNVIEPLKKSCNWNGERPDWNNFCKYYPRTHKDICNGTGEPPTLTPSQP